MELKHFIDLIADLPQNSQFKYVRGDDKCTFVSIDKSEPRIFSKTPQGKDFSFAGSYLSLLAERIEVYVPFNISQLMNNSGANRPVVETIVAHTKEFYWLQKNGAKFVVWIPSHPHNVGELVQWSDFDYLKEKSDSERNRKNRMQTQTNENLPRQIIYYGAPGTGKSHKIKSEIKVHSHLRTTFHPDSDYSTFVGAYKPKMEPTLLRDLSGHRVKDEKTGNELWSKQIVYDFVPQAFLKAYLKAWEIYPKKQYLIIEEINRGNCAQIFGDLFQLLDRNSLNFSDYPITADDDLQSYIKDHIKVEHIGEEEIARINEMYSDEYDDVFSAIKKGEMLLLPPNLYIWATMNTSDQSLFPIDSAFKRRWDWEYIPIENAGKGFYIEIGDKKYDWWNFVETINGKIDAITGSEDKKLGYWFAKPAGDSKVITSKMFVSKVLFYLWNDVYKDYAKSSQSIFHIKAGENIKEVSFSEFFGRDAEAKMQTFMEYNGIHALTDDGFSVQDEYSADEEAGVPTSLRDYSRYSLNGAGSYGKGELVRRTIESYCSQHPEMNAETIRNTWMGLMLPIQHLVETQYEFETRTKNSSDSNKRAKVLSLVNGEQVYISTQIGSGNISEFIDVVNGKHWGISIEKVQGNENPD